jgi:hypothetical protein
VILSGCNSTVCYCLKNFVGWAWVYTGIEPVLWGIIVTCIILKRPKLTSVQQSIP